MIASKKNVGNSFFKFENPKKNPFQTRSGMFEAAEEGKDSNGLNPRHFQLQTAVAKQKQNVYIEDENGSNLRSDRFRDDQEQHLAKREQFAINLRREKKKDILNLKRKNLLKQRNANSLCNQEERKIAETAMKDEENGVGADSISSSNGGAHDTNVATQSLWEHMAFLETHLFGDNIIQTTHILTVMCENFAQKISEADGNFLKLAQIDDQMTNLIQHVPNQQTLLTLLAQSGTPYDQDSCPAKLQVRKLVMHILYELSQITNYGQFLINNCCNEVLHMFAENLSKIKSWCQDSNSDQFEVDKEIYEDIYLVLSLLNNTLADEYQEENGDQHQRNKYVAQIFLQQSDSFFQNLLAESFEAFISLKAKKQLSSKPFDDYWLLKIVGEFSYSFYIIVKTDQAQIALCKPELCRMLQVFFTDNDLVEKCQLDLTTTANSQETEPDDDELLELQSESEPIRMQILHLVLVAIIDDQSQVSPQTKEEIGRISLPLVIKEMSQVSNLKSLKICLEVLIQITSFDSEELCSSIIQDIAVLRMIDSHLLNGSIQHRRLAFHLIGNFVNNSAVGALKIVKDLGLMMRILEGMYSQRDFNTTKEANQVFLDIMLVVSRMNQPLQNEIFDELFKMQSPHISPPIKPIQLLINNLQQSRLSSYAAIQLMTLRMLQILFSHNAEKYALDFEKYDGINHLQALQYSQHQIIYEVAHKIILNFFEGEEIDEPPQNHQQEEQLTSKININNGTTITGDKKQQVFVI